MDVRAGDCSLGDEAVTVTEYYETDLTVRGSVDVEIGSLSCGSLVVPQSISDGRMAQRLFLHAARDVLVEDDEEKS